MEKIHLKQRDVILVPFPFSDQSGTKVRPALVLSNNSFNKNSQDVIACAITTQKTANGIPVTRGNVESGILHDDCFIKPESVLKIHQALIIKTIARIKKEQFSDTIDTLQRYIKQD